MDGRPYEEKDLVYFNEQWQSWHHHSHFSHIDKQHTLNAINGSLTRAHTFLKEARWLIITLGSAFFYRLKPEAPAQYQPGVHRLSGAGGMPVANCHRAPGQVFYKHMMTIEEIN